MTFNWGNAKAPPLSGVQKKAGEPKPKSKDITEWDDDTIYQHLMAKQNKLGNLGPHAEIKKAKLAKEIRKVCLKLGHDRCEKNNKLWYFFKWYVIEYE